MKLGNKMKVLPLPTTIEALKKHFIPIVKSKVGDYHDSLEFDVKFIEHMPQVDGMMFYLTVEVTKSLPMDSVLAIGQQLDTFCVSKEDFATFYNRDWVIGDGDDSLAVFMEQGRFNIWLRGWPQGTM